MVILWIIACCHCIYAVYHMIWPNIYTEMKPVKLSPDRL